MPRIEEACRKLPNSARRPGILHLSLANRRLSQGAAKLVVQDPYAFDAQDLHGADPYLQPSAAALYCTTTTHWNGDNRLAVCYTCPLRAESEPRPHVKWRIAESVAGWIARRGVVASHQQQTPIKDIMRPTRPPRSTRHLPEGSSRAVAPSERSSYGSAWHHGHADRGTRPAWRPPGGSDRPSPPDQQAHNHGDIPSSLMLLPSVGLFTSRLRLTASQGL